MAEYKKRSAYRRAHANVPEEFYSQDDDWFLRDNTIYVLNIVFGSCCLFALLASAIIFGRRLHRIRLSGKQWQVPKH